MFLPNKPYKIPITYALIGILFGLLGKNMQLFFQQAWVLIAFGIFFVVMALSLFGLFQLQLPEKLRAKIAKKSYHQKRGTYFAVILMGCLSTLILSPCVTPPLVAALGLISQTGNMLLGGFALFAMGFGMGAPLLLIGALGPKILPKPGKWMNVIKNGLGIVLLGIAVMMFQRAEPQLFQLPFAAKESSVLAFQPVHSVQDIHNAVKKAAKEHRLVMLDFYADWCIACKELEVNTFSDPAVKQALSQFVLLRADITKNSPENQLVLQYFGIIAPPTLLFFYDGREVPKSRIIGYQPPAQFLRKCRHLTVK